jgi:transketolase N-terminal domain/subunit
LSESTKLGSYVVAAVPGIGPVACATLLARLPELGSLNRCEVAAWQESQHSTPQSGAWRGPSTILSGRAAVRTALYMATLTAVRHQPALRAFYQRPPGGFSSHVAPTTPGSIHEGGELGYLLSHAFGAAFDDPDLIVACVVGDGEAETGPLATAWQSNEVLNPVCDGAVLPVLHLNGYKFSNPTVPARIEREELKQFLRGCGWTPYFVESDKPEEMHQLMAATMAAYIEKTTNEGQKSRERVNLRDSVSAPRAIGDSAFCVLATA